MNAEGYRKKIRSLKPEISQTASQFVTHAFTQWLATAGIDDDLEKDLIIKDKFLSIFHTELRMYLR